MEENWNDEDFESFLLEKETQEKEFAEYKKMLHALAWPFVLFWATLFMSGPCETTKYFFILCCLALVCRIFLRYLCDYSHLTCTLIGMASFFLSYAIVWFGWRELDSNYDYAPFWMRLIWGLLL